MSTGSGSPLSTCADMSGSTSARQTKFSMNWLGSSTASHATPLMPGNAGIGHPRQHVMQPMAEFVKQRGHLVMRQQARARRRPAR